MADYTFAFTPSTPNNRQELLRRIRQFNRDELLWLSLEGRRRLRRKLLKRSHQQHRALDMAEYARTKPLEDCVGRNRTN